VKVMKTSVLLGYLFVVALAGCAADITGVPDDTAAAAPDAAPKNDDHRERPEVCGDGLDDNGNGFIDDGCSCSSGQTQACWPGVRMQRGVGACRDGVQRCIVDDSEFPKWGPCTGAVLPEADSSDDGIDQDCDGQGELLRCVPKPEVCSGGLDEDCDGKIDCEDTDCQAHTACAPRCTPSAEQCTGGKDEDCDGKIDCADTDCGSNAACAPKCTPTAEQCTDGKDNDCDGKIDCGDTNCAGHSACAPACEPWPSWEICGDGKDNECDGKTDCDDDECWDDNDCSCYEVCTPGATRWCDEEQFCHWGSQTCGPDRRWGACTETNARPAGCGNEYFYDDECCANAGQCCQAMPVFPEFYSIGTCQPLQVVCEPT
jgi:hypothetical protein